MSQWDADVETVKRLGAAQQHKLDTWQGLVGTLGQILYESHNPVVEKLAQDALNIAQPLSVRLAE